MSTRDPLLPASAGEERGAKAPGAPETGGNVALHLGRRRSHEPGRTADRAGSGDGAVSESDVSTSGAWHHSGHQSQHGEADPAGPEPRSNLSSATSSSPRNSPFFSTQEVVQGFGALDDLLRVLEQLGSQPSTRSSEGSVQPEARASGSGSAAGSASAVPVPKGSKGAAGKNLAQRMIHKQRSNRRAIMLTDAQQRLTLELELFKHQVERGLRSREGAGVGASEHGAGAALARSRTEHANVLDALAGDSEDDEAARRQLQRTATQHVPSGTGNSDRRGPSARARRKSMTAGAKTSDGSPLPSRFSSRRPSLQESSPHHSSVPGSSPHVSRRTNTTGASSHAHHLSSSHAGGSAHGLDGDRYGGALAAADVLSGAAVARERHESARTSQRHSGRVSGRASCAGLPAAYCAEMAARPAPVRGHASGGGEAAEESAHSGSEHSSRESAQGPDDGAGVLETLMEIADAVLQMDVATFEQQYRGLVSRLEKLRRVCLERPNRLLTTKLLVILTGFSRFISLGKADGTVSPGGVARGSGDGTSEQAAPRHRLARGSGMAAGGVQRMATASDSSMRRERAASAGRKHAAAATAAVRWASGEGAQLSTASSFGPMAEAERGSLTEAERTGHRVIIEDRFILSPKAGALGGSRSEIAEGTASRPEPGRSRSQATSGGSDGLDGEEATGRASAGDSAAPQSGFLVRISTWLKHRKETKAAKKEVKEREKRDRREARERRHGSASSAATGDLSRGSFSGRAQEASRHRTTARLRLDTVGEGAALKVSEADPALDEDRTGVQGVADGHVEPEPDSFSVARTRLSLDINRVPMSMMEVVCRICEKLVPVSIISEHSRVCAVVEAAVGQHDAARAADVDLVLARFAMALENKELPRMKRAQGSLYRTSQLKQLVAMARTASSLQPDGTVRPQQRLDEILGLLSHFGAPAAQPVQPDRRRSVSSWSGGAPPKNEDTTVTIWAQKLIELLHSKADDLKSVARVDERESKQRARPESAQAADYLSIKDFEIIKPISRGAHGRVYLARKRKTGDYFAIKTMRKKDLLRKNLVENVHNERNILATTDNPFVVRFFYSFQSKENVYLVMEYLSGGDLFSLLRNIGALEEDVAKMYIAETVLALEYCHANGVIHRDVKPDNLLIGPDGHIKLTDFGLSTRGASAWDALTGEAGEGGDPAASGRAGEGGDPAASGRAGDATTLSSLNENAESAHSGAGASNGSDKGIGPHGRTGHADGERKVGTPDYVAPEILLGHPHGVEVDWWAVGVMVYELVVGVPPFNADTPEEIFDNILERDIEWPGEDGDEEDPISPACRDLIERLLCMNPAERLGHNGAGEIKMHPWFADVHWSQLSKTKAAFVPQTSSIEDTSYFFNKPVSQMSMVADLEPSEVRDVARPSSSKRRKSSLSTGSSSVMRSRGPGQSQEEARELAAVTSMTSGPSDTSTAGPNTGLTPSAAAAAEAAAVAAAEAGLTHATDSHGRKGSASTAGQPGGHGQRRKSLSVRRSVAAQGGDEALRDHLTENLLRRYREQRGSMDSARSSAWGVQGQASLDSRSSLDSRIALAHASSIPRPAEVPRPMTSAVHESHWAAAGGPAAARTSASGSGSAGAGDNAAFFSSLTGEAITVGRASRRQRTTGRLSTDRPTDPGSGPPPRPSGRALSGRQSSAGEASRKASSSGMPPSPSSITTPNAPLTASRMSREVNVRLSDEHDQRGAAPTLATLLGAGSPHGVSQPSRLSRKALRASQVSEEHPAEPPSAKASMCSDGPGSAPRTPGPASSMGCSHDSAQQAHGTRSPDGPQGSVPRRPHSLQISSHAESSFASSPSSRGVAGDGSVLDSRPNSAHPGATVRSNTSRRSLAIDRRQNPSWSARHRAAVGFVAGDQGPRLLPPQEGVERQPSDGTEGGARGSGSDDPFLRNEGSMGDERSSDSTEESSGGDAHGAFSGFSFRNVTQLANRTIEQVAVSGHNSPRSTGSRGLAPTASGSHHDTGSPQRRGSVQDLPQDSSAGRKGPGVTRMGSQTKRRGSVGGPATRLDQMTTNEAVGPSSMATALEALGSFELDLDDSGRASK
ncbi:unnamed protein product [Pedinophyceae sp. YPF-701]|nr:unnamed protein product [Pedinophyceae sp. YPF-701]